MIAGVTRPEQLNENLVATRWRPTAEEVVELEAILPKDLSGGPGRVTGSAIAGIGFSATGRTAERTTADRIVRGPDDGR